LSEVFAEVERASLWATDLEFLRLHYAKTLNHWCQRFEANRAKIAEIYDERFCRMWEFYLISAEMMFRTGSQLVFQMQLARKRDAVPIARDYISDLQRHYRKVEDLSDASPRGVPGHEPSRRGVAPPLRVATQRRNS
jgi:cyclopropane-fatty-acyl-phospholipid synthase